MRLATYNVENLFDRPGVFGLPDDADRKRLLKAYAEVSDLLEMPAYTPARKRQILKHLTTLGLANKDECKLSRLRVNHGRLLRRPRNGDAEVVAEGRNDWVGLVELRTEPVDAIAMENTARVICEIDADVIGVVEADNRVVLDGFSRTLLPTVQGQPYEHVMLIDGNDLRGIDVGVMTKTGYDIVSICSHIDDRLPGNGNRIFSRDCAVYSIATPSGNRLCLLMNHFKSKGYGSMQDSNAKRKAQASRVAQIYQELIEEGEQYIAIAGDFNDNPDSAPLEPLLRATDLRDVSELDNGRFGDGEYPGTYKGCTASNKIDYILLSPALYSKTEAGGIFRKGMWPGVRPPKWAVYESITEEVHAASDHACVWADFVL